MDFNGFLKKDFDVFFIDGLEPRMKELKQNITPKLEALGKEIAPFLSILAKEEISYHVAKHARRTKNPPNDTWVAWSNSKRGYKSLPHFQVGLWQSHLFVMFALIYEANSKERFANQLLKNPNVILHKIPKHFVWSFDHTKPETVPHSLLGLENFKIQVEKLKAVKKSELLCGITIDRNNSILQNKKELIATIEDTFNHLMILYQANHPSL